MNDDRIATLLLYGRAFDTETHKIQPGLLAPPLVCASVADRSGGKLLDKDHARRTFETLLDDDTVVIAGANIAYDMVVMAHDAAQRGVNLMPAIFRAYEAGRIYDVQVAEALHAIAIGMLGKDPRNGQPLRDPLTKKRGRYSLSICLDLVLGRCDAKVNDRFRFSYALLEDTPIEQWPSEARVYPVDDACNTLDVMLAQTGHLERPAEHEWSDNLDGPCIHCGVRIGFSEPPPCPPRRWQNLNLHDLSRQCYAAFAMQLGAAWGFSVDPHAVEELETRVRASRERGMITLLEHGFLRWKKEKGMTKASRHTAVIKRSVALAYGCAGACLVCGGTQKVASAKTGKPVGCRACDSTGLNLNSAPVPRTKGSKCRTCKSTRLIGPNTTCTQCAGQPEIIPGCGTGRDVLYESGEEKLIEFAAWLEESKLLETYLPFVKKGIADVPDDNNEDEGDDE